MKKSDEFIELERKFRSLKESGGIKGEALELAENMFEVLKSNETRLSEIEDRLMKLEDFSDIISVDLYNMQTELIKHMDPDDIEEIEETSDDDDSDEEISSCGHHHDGCCCGEDDEESEDEGSQFVRCPFCNTLIFIKETDEEITCPFCGENFFRSDVTD